MSTQTQFKTAAEEVQRLEAKPTNEEKLKLYGLYKVATNENFSKAERPGMFDLMGKAKYNAWAANANAGMTPTKAQQEYTEYVDALKEKYGFKA